MKFRSAVLGTLFGFGTVYLLIQLVTTIQTQSLSEVVACLAAICLVAVLTLMFFRDALPKRRKPNDVSKREKLSQRESQEETESESR